MAIRCLISLKCFNCNNPSGQPAVVAERSQSHCFKFKQRQTLSSQGRILLGARISIAQSQKWLVTIQIIGRRVAASYRSSMTSEGSFCLLHQGNTMIYSKVLEYTKTLTQSLMTNFSFLFRIKLTRAGFELRISLVASRCANHLAIMTSLVRSV